jgi:hypothetical protein
MLQPAAPRDHLVSRNLGTCIGKNLSALQVQRVQQDVNGEFASATLYTLHVNAR